MAAIRDSRFEQKQRKGLLMDAMDVLGALLGKKSQSGGSGGSILKDMLGGRKPKAEPQQPRRQHPQSRAPVTIEGAATSLEDLLNVSNEHHQSRRQAPRSPAPSRPSSPAPRRSPAAEAMNEQSKVLVRAMVSSAKADGQITRDEQESILKQLDHVSQEEIDFLKAEFARPVDVKEFTWSVPRGMEEQVYAISLLAIDLDEQKEANYLADLAHGLRLDLARCNEIHRNYRAPEIFKA
jgi:uncharacterized membrane protein YebE (DUF533 family)